MEKGKSILLLVLLPMWVFAAGLVWGETACYEDANVCPGSEFSGVVSGIYTGGAGHARGVYGESQYGTGVEGRSEGGVGVSGFSSGGYGVMGTTMMGNAIDGGDDWDGTGVRGSSPYGYGVHGTCVGEDVAGVFGEGEPGVEGNGSTTGVLGTGGSYGVHGTSFSTGVLGESTPAAGVAYGVHGTSKSTEGRGVLGEAKAASGAAYGVYGVSFSNAGRGVSGWASAASGTTFGVHGSTQSTAGRGVYGEASASSGTTYGMHGRSQSTGGRGVYGLASATSGSAFGVYGYSQSTAGRGVYGEASATTGTTYGVYGRAQSSKGYGVYAQGRLHATGNFTAAGTKSAVVSLDNGEGVRLYAEEGTQNWFFDVGSGRIEEGMALVTIDPTFVQTVNTQVQYHVFLTPEGDCKGLYVTQKREDSFEVRELDGGKSTVPFSYRIVAKRKGYEEERLATVPREEMVALTAPEGVTTVTVDTGEGTERPGVNFAEVNAKAMSREGQTDR